MKSETASRHFHQSTGAFQLDRPEDDGKRYDTKRTVERDGIKARMLLREMLEA